MQLNTLKPNYKNVTSVVVGRGGKRGKTSGRGGKGQTARAGHKIRPEARDMIKKIPKLRGHGKNRSRGVRRDRASYAPVNLAALERFELATTITPKFLLEHKLVRAAKGRAPKVKILGVGVAKAHTFKGVAFSASARAAALKAGGTINA